MNIWNFLKGPVTRNVKEGVEGRYTRLGPVGRHQPIRLIELEYRSQQVECRYWWPWIKPTATTVWHINALAHCEDTRTLTFGLIIEGELEAVLDYAYSTVLDAAVQQILNEREMFLRVLPGSRTRH